MLFPRVLALLSQAALGVVAVQQNLAGVVDWHKAHVGLPLPPVAALRGGPSFETFKAADGSERTSIITLTRSNIAASLNAETGSIGASGRHLAAAPSPRLAALAARERP